MFTKQAPRVRPLTWAVLLAAVFVLGGCAAGSQAFRDGNRLLDAGRTEEGLRQLDQAVSQAPGNAEYRIVAANRRFSLINQLLEQGDDAARRNELNEAEKSYRQVLVIDAKNAAVRQRLVALDRERQRAETLKKIEQVVRDSNVAELAAASESLRAILAEEPQHARALGLKTQVDELVEKNSPRRKQLAAIYSKKIALEFRDAPLKSVFDFISQVSGLNIFFDSEVKPDLRATVLAKNTSIEDAVRLLLSTNQLEQTVLNENSILVYPNTPQKVRDYQTLVVRTFYIVNADVKSLSTNLKTILKLKDVVTDERLGLIIVRDTPDVVRLAEQMINVQDMADPEVMLELEVMEVKRSRLLELGIQWPSQLTLSPLPSGKVLTLSDLKNIRSSTIQAGLGATALNLRKEDQDANILANPRVRVKNKEKAKILIGDRVPVITSTSTSSGFVSESITYLDVGLKLEVEPLIYLDDEVAIKVALEVSSLVKEVPTNSGALSYQIGTRGANTTLRLKNGETQVLAGLINNEDRSSANKIPGLGELPVLGRLFGSQKDDKQQSEILLSITPRIVRSVRRPDLVHAEFESGTESVVGVPSLKLRELKDAAEKEPSTPPAIADKPATPPAAPTGP